jgi:hypothetical protein
MGLINDTDYSLDIKVQLEGEQQPRHFYSYFKKYGCNYGFMLKIMIESDILGLVM